MRNKFTINFFEFAFLVEACIPPRSIARAMFWNKVCDVYYHNMTEAERNKLFDWIRKSNNFNIDIEDCKVFYHRYDPDSQYMVYFDYEGDKGSKHAYLMDDEYHTTKNTTIMDEYIIKVEEI